MSTVLRRSVASRLALALLAATFAATPAFALPDYVTFTPPGWSSPLPIRTTADATGTNALDSPVLTGDGSSYVSYALRNNGTTAGAAIVVVRSGFDGVVANVSGTPGLPLGVGAFGLNLNFTVRGGLHTAFDSLDTDNATVESNEANNVYARQLSFTPANLAVGAQVTRVAPPLQLGGTAAVTGTVYANVDGMRLPPNDQPWEGVALTPPAGEDYDLALFDATTGIGNGFRTALATSAQGTGRTDFILNNGNFVGAPAHDVGVSNYTSTAGSYRLEHRQASGAFLTLGSLAGHSLTANQMLDLFEYQHLPSTGVPRVVITLTATPGQVLHVALFSPASLASRSGALADVATDANGIANVDVALETTGSPRYYGVVVFRDQGDGGTASAPYTLRLRATPAELSNAQQVGFTTPVNASNAGANYTTDPVALDGNATSTTMSLYFTNTGPVSATGFSTDTRLDGTSILQFPDSPLAPNATGQVALGPVFVRGGRHTLSYATDVTGAIDEIDETNNGYGRQFVWSPLVMTEGVTLTRAMPPQPDGGWSDIPASVTKYFNVDGLRTANYVTTPSRGNVIALMPGAGSDVDLNAYAPSTGPLDGFAAPLTSSIEAGDHVDMIVDYPLASIRTWDMGVQRYIGTNQSYAIQNVMAVGFVIDPTVIGGGSIAAGDIVYATNFTLTNGSPTLTVVLDNLSGNADLGLSIYSANTTAGPVSLRDTPSGGFADDNGPGASEVAIANVAGLDNHFVAVVWKKSAAELGKTASFRLRFNPATTGVEPSLPHALAFAVGGGNPVGAATRLTFDLPTERNVTLDVLDVQGRRVRTLVNGVQPAGAHALAFDGRDAAGSRLASGAYFARFTAGDFQRVRKLVVLE
jgi:hypothetical protein